MTRKKSLNFAIHSIIVFVHSSKCAKNEDVKKTEKKVRIRDANIKKDRESLANKEKKEEEAKLKMERQKEERNIERVTS